jgi:iron complex outermembrane receptor protein
LSGQPLNEPYNQIDSYGLWSARLTLSDIAVGSGGLEFSLWGKNLADEEYLLDGVVTFPWSPKVGLFGDPRSYGMDVVYRWQ